MFVFCVAAGAALSACSGETTENPGGGGGSGGSGGAGTTSSTTASSTTGASTSSTTTAATTSASSGSGGGGGSGSECDQACAKVEECGQLTCGDLGIECSDPNYECASQCILDTPCEQLNLSNSDLLVCFSDCDGAAGNEGAAECRSCAIENNCLTACAFNTTCQNWLGCAQACFQNDPQPTCFDACDTEFSAAETQFDAVYTCACTSCEDTCESVADPCSQL
ncbi:hypothetical protein BE17_50945 [Sorangium cellulosum]|uniref:Uncharacterized protein n=1 Tax=Sorangium cellulosum TaxID=56 RepID=A0A150RSI2_SORCE|nr:hypothetical protein BE17_50945 [Sorangium cellulosum]